MPGTGKGICSKVRATSTSLAWSSAVPGSWCWCRLNNVCDAVTAPRPTKKEMEPLTPQQARQLLENVREDRLRALYVLAITARLQEGELLGLRWEDSDLERKLLQVRRQLTRTRDGLSFTAPRRGKARVVRLTDLAIAALEAREAQGSQLVSLRSES